MSNDKELLAIYEAAIRDIVAFTTTIPNGQDKRGHILESVYAIARKAQEQSVAFKRTD